MTPLFGLARARALYPAGERGRRILVDTERHYVFVNWRGLDWPLGYARFPKLGYGLAVLNVLGAELVLCHTLKAAGARPR